MRFAGLLALHLLVLPAVAAAVALPLSGAVPEGYPDTLRAAGLALAGAGLLAMTGTLIGLFLSGQNDTMPGLPWRLRLRAADQIVHGSPPVHPDQLDYLRFAAGRLGATPPWPVLLGGSFVMQAAGRLLVWADDPFGAWVATWVGSAGLVLVVQQGRQWRRARAFLAAHPA